MTIDEAYKTCFCEPYIVPVEKHKEARAVIDKALEEVQHYRAIGTVEECMAAVEKQKANEPIFEFNISDNVSRFTCKCGNKIKVTHDSGIMNNNDAPNYCSNCGQKLKW